MFFYFSRLDASSDIRFGVATNQWQTHTHKFLISNSISRAVATRRKKHETITKLLSSAHPLILFAHFFSLSLQIHQQIDINLCLKWIRFLLLFIWLRKTHLQCFNVLLFSCCEINFANSVFTAGFSRFSWYSNVSPRVVSVIYWLSIMPINRWPANFFIIHAYVYCM